MKYPYIVLCGTQSVGKTTLAEALIPLLEDAYGQNVMYLSEVARSIRKKHNVALNKEASAKTQWMIEQEYIRLEAETQGKLRIADRSIIDRYSYTILNEGSVLDKIDLLQWYDDNVRATCHEYSHLFYIPLVDNLKLHEDGVRSTDADYRKEVDRLMYSIIGRYALNAHFLRGTTQERLEQISKVLENSNGIKLRITNASPSGSKQAQRL